MLEAVIEQKNVSCRKALQQNTGGVIPISPDADGRNSRAQEDLGFISGQGGWSFCAGRKDDVFSRRAAPVTARENGRRVTTVHELGSEIDGQGRLARTANRDSADAYDRNSQSRHRRCIARAAATLPLASHSPQGRERAQDCDGQRITRHSVSSAKIQVEQNGRQPLRNPAPRLYHALRKFTKLPRIRAICEQAA